MMSAPNQSETNTTVDLLRHGEVQTPDLFCAPVREPLSEAGRLQMQNGCEGGQWDHIVSSSSTRCADFSKQLAKQRGMACTLRDDFAELDFGDWVSQTRADVWAQSPGLLQSLWADPQGFVAPGGESMAAFIVRVSEGWQHCVSNHAGQRVLLVSHAGVIRVILAQVLQIDYAKTLRFELAHGARHRLTVYPDGEATLNFLGLKGLSSQTRETSSTT